MKPLSFGVKPKSNRVSEMCCISALSLKDGVDILIMFYYFLSEAGLQHKNLRVSVKPKRRI